MNNVTNPCGSCIPSPDDKSGSNACSCQGNRRAKSTSCSLGYQRGRQMTRGRDPGQWHSRGLVQGRAPASEDSIPPQLLQHASGMRLTLWRGPAQHTVEWSDMHVASMGTSPCCNNQNCLQTLQSLGGGWRGGSSHDWLQAMVSGPKAKQPNAKLCRPEQEIKYWVGQKVHLGFSVRCYGKTQTNSLATPTYIYFKAFKIFF